MNEYNRFLPETVLMKKLLWNLCCLIIGVVLERLPSANLFVVLYALFIGVSARLNLFSVVDSSGKLVVRLRAHPSAFCLPVDGSNRK